MSWTNYPEPPKIKIDRYIYHWRGHLFLKQNLFSVSFCWGWIRVNDFIFHFLIIFAKSIKHVPSSCWFVRLLNSLCKIPLGWQGFQIGRTRLYLDIPAWGKLGMCTSGGARHRFVYVLNPTSRARQQSPMSTPIPKQRIPFHRDISHYYLL